MTPWFHSIHIFAFLHSLYVHGRKRTLVFLAIGFSLGLASEHVGAAYGWIFGKFHYQPDRLMFFGTVPIFTPLSWWLILYCAYNTTNLIIGDPASGGQKSLRRFLAVPLMAGLDGLMAMNLDMLFDPIMVCPERKRWVWEFGGSYFDIPIQNFLGWFLVGFTISLLIRLYDMRAGPSVSLGGRFVHYLPSGLYGLMFALFALLSVIDGYPQYALIGFGGMAPFVLLAAVRACLSLRAEPGR
jgi:putative membrane protein